MSDRDAGNTHEALSEIFRAMNVKIADRTAANLRPWADQSPYVSGGRRHAELEAKEREIEHALVRHVTKFLLELGAGFSFLGRQVLLDVGGEPKRRTCWLRSRSWPSTGLTTSAKSGWRTSFIGCSAPCSST